MGGQVREMACYGKWEGRVGGQMIMREDVGRPMVRRKGWKRGLVVFCK